MSVSLQDVQTALERIKRYVHRTPLERHQSLNDLSGAELWFKSENKQKCGAFKARGAHHALTQLTPEQLARGVATHSSGNHGAALALAARRFGAQAFVVMPSNAPVPKRQATLAYGATVIDCEPTLEAREAALKACVERTGAVFVPPYDHPDIIAGQGTLALEMLEQNPNLDAILVPVGGGGMLAGVSLAVKALRPDIKVIGVEPLGADDAKRSFLTGQHVRQHQPDTIADGLRTTLGTLNFALIRDHTDDIVTVTDAQITAAMKVFMVRAKALVEPSGIVGLAAVMADPSRFAKQQVGIVISGGNVDLEHPVWL
ncbi:Threonine dehydratase, catabolic [Aequoribacter fuscus]|jgi:threonine dehydratase|uniref:Threonine dehydratase, catabolic n=1 Tax=Aequoribacter fuscus TaxID=2518989 RepID=F3KYU8_9GAMM|nr:threonine/serine dehydratase [Aequoribacter fuscus]EGG30771.1 Threonine dehydratase, catabolic [Aequoribacter fuscus]QHJ86820.1 threonine/serine dehydratase [Aequoribacter fuscus]